MTLKRGARCMAPLEGDTSGSLNQTCGRKAVTEREVEGVVFPLCRQHSQELDDERGEEDLEEGDDVDLSAEI